MYARAYMIATPLNLFYFDLYFSKFNLYIFSFHIGFIGALSIVSYQPS